MVYKNAKKLLKHAGLLSKAVKMKLSIKKLGETKWFLDDA